MPTQLTHMLDALLKCAAPQQYIKSALEHSLDDILDKKKPSMLDGIKNKATSIYKDFDNGKFLADRSPGKFTGSDLLIQPARLGMEGARKAYKFHAGLYKQLEKRYGPRYAKVIIGTWAAAAPIPGPFSPVFAAPVIGVAEIHRQINNLRHRDTPPPSTE